MRFFFRNLRHGDVRSGFIEVGNHVATGDLLFIIIKIEDFLFHEVLGCGPALKAGSRVGELLHDGVCLFEGLVLLVFQLLLLSFFQGLVRRPPGLFPLGHDVGDGQLPVHRRLGDAFFRQGQAHLPVVFLDQVVLEAGPQGLVNLPVFLGLLLRRLVQGVLEEGEVVGQRTDFLHIRLDLAGLGGVHNFAHVPLDFGRDILRVVLARRDLHLGDNHGVGQELAPGFRYVVRADFRQAVRLLPHLSVFLGLVLVQRAVEHLQLHGPLHIGPVPEPENNLVAEIDALVRLAGLVIESRQLVGPFLGKVPGLQLLENSNQGGVVRPSGLVQLIENNIFEVVVGGNLHELVVVFLRLVVLAQLDGYEGQAVDDHAADGRALVGNLQKFPGILPPTGRLVDVGRLHHDIDIADLAEIHGIEHEEGVFGLPLLHESLNLVEFCSVFGTFSQFLSPYV